MKNKDHIKIGYVSKTHGLKGEITANIEAAVDWGSVASLFLDSRGSLVPYFIEKISGTVGKPFIKFEGIQNVEQASTLKGCSIYIGESVRPKLKRTEFYDDEVIGFLADDKNLGPIGHVKEIQRQGGNRLIVILQGTKEILVPVNAPFVKSLNKTKKLIRLELPEGFLDF